MKIFLIAASFIISTLITLSIFAQQTSCKLVGTVQIKVLAKWCYSYQENKSVLCKKALPNFQPNLYSASYEYYIYENGSIQPASQRIPNMTPTRICLNRFDPKNIDQAPWAIIITQYGGGFTFTTIPVVRGNVKLVVQPIVDPNPDHWGANVVFCKQGFGPGRQDEMCSLNNVTQIP